MENKTKMPVLFIGIDDPIYGYENNEFTAKWKELGKIIPRPRAILFISPDWPSIGISVTGKNPKTIYYTNGNPDEPSNVKYDVKGDKFLAEEIINEIQSPKVKVDLEKGIEPECWAVLKNIFPNGDIPVVQLSINDKNYKYHFELGKKLRFLRDKGILIIGSGNMIYESRKLKSKRNYPKGIFDNSSELESNKIFKKIITEEEYDYLLDRRLLDKAITSSFVINRYIPMLYALGLRDKNEKLEFFNDKFIDDFLSMTSFIIGDN